MANADAVLDDEVRGLCAPAGRPAVETSARTRNAAASGRVVTAFDMLVPVTWSHLQ